MGGSTSLQCYISHLSLVFMHFAFRPSFYGIGTLPDNPPQDGGEKRTGVATSPAYLTALGELNVENDSLLSYRNFPKLLKYVTSCRAFPDQLLLETGDLRDGIALDRLFQRKRKESP